jgi:hypothetical protein
MTMIRRIYLLVLISMTVLGACGHEGQPGSAESTAGPIELTASLSATKQHVIIRNGDIFVWKDATFILNGNYEYKMSLVPRGSVSLNLADFRREDGTAFRPGKDWMRSLRIIVPDAVDGHAGYYEW